jgi:hypothetical protein
MEKKHYPELGKKLIADECPVAVAIGENPDVLKHGYSRNVISHESSHYADPQPHVASLGRAVGDRALTLDDIAKRYALGELKFDSTKLAEKLVDDDVLAGYSPSDVVATERLAAKGFYTFAEGSQEDAMTARLFDAYHELEEAYEKIHLLELKLSQIRQVLTCDMPTQAAVIATLSILNEIHATESVSLDIETAPNTKRSV